MIPRKRKGEERTYWLADLAAERPSYLSRHWWAEILKARPYRDQVPYGDANLISSKTTHGRHLPVIDLDRGFATVESTTPGHGHLYLETPMSWPRYVVLLAALWWAGVIEPGFFLYSIKRGASFVRLPHVKKYETPAVAPESDAIGVATLGELARDPRDDL